MNNKIYLLLSILQLIIGAILIVSFVVLAIGGYEVKSYITTLAIAIFFVVMGTVSTVNWKRKNK